MEYVNLFDICIPKQWKTLSGNELDDDGKYFVYGANGIIGKFNKYNHDKETVVVGCRGSCGKESVRIVPAYSYINGNAMCFDNLSSNFSVKYFYYFLKSLDYSKIISGIAQPQITGKSLKNIKVPLISVQKQNEIVMHLDNLNLLIDCCKKELNLFDELIKSRFIGQEVSLCY